MLLFINLTVVSRLPIEKIEELVSLESVKPIEATFVLATPHARVFSHQHGSR